MSTQSGDVISIDALNKLRAEFGHPPLGESFGDHVRGVMDAATDDVKSVVMPVVDVVEGIARSTTRDVVFFIAGAVFTLVVMIVSHFI